MVTFNHASDDPRDLAIRAALRDLAVIASILEPRAAPGSQRLTSSAPDANRAEYLRVLGDYIAEFGGRLDDIEGQTVAVFGERRIFIVFSRYA